MNKKKLIVIIIFIFAAVSMLLVFTQRPNPKNINLVSETNGTGGVVTDLVGATGIKSFADAFNRTSNLQNNINRTTSGVSTIRPVRTPIPLPYPRISINYTSQRAASIREKSAGKNNTFILVAVDIRNYGYKYFDADPTKFRLEPLRPILNVSTGNMLDAVVPNNSEAQGDLVFLTDKKQSFTSRLSYISGGYTIIFNPRGQVSGIHRTVSVVYD